MEDERRVSSTPASSGAPLQREAEAGVPLITWAISGAALLIIVAAAVILLSPPPAAPVGPVATANEATEPAPLEPLPVPRIHPLSLSRKLLTAQERASVWNPNAQLTGISLVIENERPLGATEFKFGIPTGQSMPGAPVGSSRYAVTFENDSIRVTETQSAAGATALPVPNCPLDAAFRTIKSLGVPAESRVGVLLIHSERHRRPVWLMTTSDGQAHQVNAENCVMLRR